MVGAVNKSASYSEEDARRDLPELSDWSDKLMEIASDVLERNEMRITSQPFRLMCLSFLSRQVDHVGSLIALHGHRDMMLIARSMLEGAVMLMWVSENSESRSARWRDYAYVHDWKMLRRHQREGRLVSEDDLSKVEKELEKVGKQFYTRKARKRDERSEPLPDDPYVYGWLGHSWYKLFQKVQLPDWYERFYAPFSDWHHWGAASLMGSVKKTEQGFLYSSERADDTVYALLIGISSLHVTLQVPNVELRLGIHHDLEAFRVGFEAWHSDRGARWGIPFLAPPSR